VNLGETDAGNGIIGLSSPRRGGYARRMTFARRHPVTAAFLVLSIVPVIVVLGYAGSRDIRLDGLRSHCPGLG